MTRVKGKPRRCARTAPTATLADFPVDWVIGGKRMQDDGHRVPRRPLAGAAGLLPRRRKTSGSTTPRPSKARSRPSTRSTGRTRAGWRTTSASTATRRTSRSATTTRRSKWTTTFTDGSVACESCHGAGGKHADSPTKADIIASASMRARSASTACARCHGPRQPLWPLLDPEHRFGSARATTRLRSDRRHDAGRRHVERLLRRWPAERRRASSTRRCCSRRAYRKGGATCLTCHTAPHEREAQGRAARGRPTTLCRRAATRTSRRITRTSQAAVTCVAATCRRSSAACSITSPITRSTCPIRPHTTQHRSERVRRRATPTRPLDELAASIAKWWPDAGKRQARRERLADAFDEATAGASRTRRCVAVIADKDEAPTLRGAAAIMLGAARGPRAAGAIDAAARGPERRPAREGLRGARRRARARARPTRSRSTSPIRRCACSSACALALLDMRDPRGERRAASSSRTSRRPRTSMLPHLELGTRARCRRKDFADGAKRADDRREAVAVLHRRARRARGDRRRARRLRRSARADRRRSCSSSLTIKGALGLQASYLTETGRLRGPSASHRHSCR